MMLPEKRPLPPLDPSASTVGRRAMSQQAER
jgi:hypothetical protein